MGDLERYLRQTALKEVGPEGQERIQGLSVLIVGAGGLGCPAALYLAAAGVGVIGLVDNDDVELSNLQRQVLYRDDDIGKAKAEIAGARLTELNQDTRASIYNEKYDEESAVRITRDYDVVIGATDNFVSRMVIASTCHAMGIPYVFSGINRFDVQLMSVMPGKTPCFACLYGDAFDSEDPPQGPLGGVAGIGGTLQALEALKIGAKFGEPLYGRLLVFDTLNMHPRIVPVERRTDCPVCGADEN